MSELKNTLEKMRQEEREARRNLILDAAVKLFSSMPFKQVGMRDIAAEAGMSAASLYRYFADRDELFVEAFIRENNAITKVFADYMESTEGNDPIKAVSKILVRYLIENEAFFQMMTHFMIDGQINNESLTKFNSLESGTLSIIEKALHDSGAQGETRLMAHCMLAALNGIVITYRNYPGRSSEEAIVHMMRLAELLADVFRNTI